MVQMQRIISDELVYALGWTVVHSLWQAMLIALVMAMILVGLQKRSARLRYGVANVALILVLISALVTFDLLYRSARRNIPEAGAVWSGSMAEEALPGQQAAASFLDQCVQYFNQHLPLIVLLWLMGAAFFMLRLLGGMAYIQLLKHRGTAPLPVSWQERLAHLSVRASVEQPVKLMESSLVRVPMVLGYFKPVILLPVGAVNALTPGEVEAILAHELGHVLRKDFLWNLFQSFIEVLFYFNPAVWWISANIRAERENCCDDIAISLCGDSLTYAKALVRLQEMNLVSPRLAMTFSGRRHQLLNRIRRILNQPQNKSNIMEKFAVTCLLLLLVFSASVSAGLPVEEPDGVNVEVVHLDRIVPEEIKTELPADTLPKGKTRLDVIRNGQEIDARIEEGKITFLKIDGKEIAESEYEQYVPMIESMLEEVPEPPKPPLPPSVRIPVPPRPPLPPAASIPAPPHAPRVHFRDVKEKTQISTEKDDQGNTVIIINGEDGKEPIRLEVRQENGNAIYLGGEELLDGETAIIIDETAPGGWRFTAPGWRLTTDSLLWNAHPLWQKQLAEELARHGHQLKLEKELLEGMNLQDQELRERMKRQEVEVRQHIERQREMIREQLREFRRHNDEEDAVLVLPAPRGKNYTFGYFPDAGRLDSDVQSTLERRMLDDGLIKNTEKYQLELSGKGMKLNGKNMPEGIAQKYKQLYEAITGFELTNKSRIVIDKDERRE